MNCPACNSREVGKIGVNEFFCWSCSVEFDKKHIYYIEEDGKRTNSEDLIS